MCRVAELNREIVREKKRKKRTVFVVCNEAVEALVELESGESRLGRSLSNAAAARLSTKLFSLSSLQRFPRAAIVLSHWTNMAHALST